MRDRRYALTDLWYAVMSGWIGHQGVVGRNGWLMAFAIVMLIVAVWPRYPKAS